MATHPKRAQRKMATMVAPVTECGFCEDGRFRHPGTDVTEPCPYCAAARSPQGETER